MYESNTKGILRLIVKRVFSYIGTTNQAGATQLASVMGSNIITAGQASGLANSLAATVNINQLLPSKYLLIYQTHTSPETHC